MNILKKLFFRKQFKKIAIERDNWQKNFCYELKFWDDWLGSEGRINNCHEEYIRKIDHKSIFQKDFTMYLSSDLRKYRILDVGAGPLTQVNKTIPGKELEIHAVDPLSDIYRKLLNKYDIRPSVITEKLDGEELTSRYPYNFFDISCANNSIDHSYNPLLVLEEMVRVTKINGYVILSSFINEGSNKNWKGFHKWDLYVKDSNLFLKRQKFRPLNVTEWFNGKLLYEHIDIGDFTFIIVFKKVKHYK